MTPANHVKRAGSAPIDASRAKSANPNFATRYADPRDQDVCRLTGSSAAQGARLQSGRVGPDARHFPELPQPDRTRRTAADGGGAAADHRGVRGGRDLDRKST